MTLFLSEGSTTCSYKKGIHSSIGALFLVLGCFFVPSCDLLGNGVTHSNVQSLFVALTWRSDEIRAGN